MSTSYTEKTHSAFHGAPIDTSDPKTLAWLIRRHGLEMTHISRGSHIGAIFSVAEIMAVLYTRILRVDPKNPQWENRDRLILSKGHAGASVYAALAERGFFPVEELSTHYANGSRLSGHVSHKGVPGVEFSTGSLGHGLSVAAGMALGGKKDNADWRVYCVLGVRAKFKPVQVVYQGDGYMLVKDAAAEEDSTMLRQGDQVIVTSAELYDGKVIG